MYKFLSVFFFPPVSCFWKANVIIFRSQIGGVCSVKARLHVTTQTVLCKSTDQMSSGVVKIHVQHNFPVISNNIEFVLRRRDAAALWSLVSLLIPVQFVVRLPVKTHNKLETRTALGPISRGPTSRDQEKNRSSRVSGPPSLLSVLQVSVRFLLYDKLEIKHHRLIVSKDFALTFWTKRETKFNCLRLKTK